MSQIATAFRIYIESSLLLAMIVFMAAAEPSARPDSAAAKGVSATVTTTSNIKRIVFGEQKIEGKIRRPQLVLIKADQRPEFQPMVMQALGKSRGIAGLVDESLIEAPHKGAFQFKGTSIINPEP